jgi:hypothetical protein
VYHFGMFKGLPRGVVVGLVVVLDMLAVWMREVIRGVSRRFDVRSAVFLFNVCLLNVLDVCMLLGARDAKVTAFGGDGMFLY